MQMPLSHQLPYYVQLFPLYNQLGRRLADYLRQGGALQGIDVGANIGDTLAVLYHDAADAFLAVEPSPKYFQYLSANWAGYDNVVPVQAMLTAQATQRGYAITESAGNAQIRPHDAGVTMVTLTLDELLVKYPRFATANLLKIDTDGYDFEILAGAEGLIARQQPAVLFECDMYNPQYVADVRRTLAMFARHGYQDLLLYDNLGYLVGKFALADQAMLGNLLFYQLSGHICYFDIVMLPPARMSGFYQAEVEYFTAHLTEPDRQHNARAALES